MKGTKTNRFQIGNGVRHPDHGEGHITAISSDLYIIKGLDGKVFRGTDENLESVPHLGKYRWDNRGKRGMKRLDS